MSKRVTTISILVLSIILIILYVVSSTYAVIINVFDKDGKSEIVNSITIRDFVINDDGTYNQIYYDTVRELEITNEEAQILMDSVFLNEALDVVLNNIVAYKLHNESKLSNLEIYELIINALNQDDTINEMLKEKVALKAKEYIKDISDYLYDTEVSNIGEIAWLF